MMSEVVTSGAQPAPQSRAWYDAPLAAFAGAAPGAVLGGLTAQSTFDVELDQRGAWEASIVLLQAALAGLDGHLFLEFEIPRMGSRADAIVLLGPLVVVIEFKVGASEFLRADRNQVWDYALDLKNFHAGSHEWPILPVLVATEAPADGDTLLRAAADGVYQPVEVAPAGLRAALERAAAVTTPAAPGAAAAWSQSSYQPTPTIIEAARALYAGHTVEAVARSGAQNLSATAGRARELMTGCRNGHRKAICFITGVPGAGKTLVGLDLAAPHSSGARGVYLSGNGPLVAVLTEALARDGYQRRHLAQPGLRLAAVRREAKAFIQSIHRYRDDYFAASSPPDEHVAIFDEAQRVWNQPQLAKFMLRRRKRAGINQSESELLIEYMDRHADWALIVCLVGEGQEINTGEAGIDTWLEALAEHFPAWEVHLSPHLCRDAKVQPWLRRLAGPRLHDDPVLHLDVSMRSFRAAGLNDFVEALLACDEGRAGEAFAGLNGRYPVLLSRDLEEARCWVREQRRGSARCGLLASSKGSRLKPLAVDVRVQVDPVQWFLKPETDTRSSYYLEDAATEFDVQGLELDWSVVCWDGDLRFGPEGWSHHAFRGERWERILQEERRVYRRNAYRVLLTRARQGMVIVVPRGEAADPTREPGFYDGTYRYLASIGLPELGARV
ncbi:MAG: DUF2075 domain-containing protein [Terriglobales bacterium]